MDITLKFREALRDARKKKGLQTPAAEILRREIQLSEFSKAAKGVVRRVVIAGDYVNANRLDWSRLLGGCLCHLLTGRHFGRFIPGKASNMTDTERDAIDEEITMLIKSCYKRVGDLQAMRDESQGNVEGSRSAHQRGLIEFLLERLQAITKSVEDQRAQRLRHAMVVKNKFLPDDESVVKEYSKTTHGDEDKLDKVVKVTENDLGLDQDELDSLRQENSILEATLQNDLEAAREMERKLVEISQLFEQFTQEVVEQHHDIEQIQDNAQDSTTNINDGNVQLEKAHEHGEGFGLFLFCFLSGSSLVLLFLDWYST